MAYEVTCFKSFTLRVAINQTTQTPSSRSEPLLECLLSPQSSRGSPSILIMSKLKLSKELQYSMLGKYQPRSCAKLVLLPKKELESLKWCYKKNQWKERVPLSTGSMPKWAIARPVEVSTQRFNNLYFGKPSWQGNSRQDGFYNLFHPKIL